jgi:hypothetical protein
VRNGSAIPADYSQRSEAEPRLFRGESFRKVRDFPHIGGRSPKNIYCQI